MSITQRFAERRAKWHVAGHPRDPVLAQILGQGNETAAKVDVTVEGAQKLAAVYACIKCISETKAALPVHVFQRNADGTTSKVSDHPVADLLHNIGPNREQTVMVFQETRQQHVLSWGNSYAEVHYAGSDVRRLTLLDPWAVRPKTTDSGRLVYELQEPDQGGTRTLRPERILHVPNYGNGIEGWSPIRLHAEAIGAGLGMQRHAASFFGNAARPSLVAELPARLSPGASERLINDIERRLSKDMAHKPFFAEGGLKLTPISIPNSEAQFIESQELNGEEIARIFRCPPHVVGFLRRATFDNITAQDLYFEKHTMQPWLVRDEQEINRKLFRPSERGRFFVKHNVDALLRSDIETRFNAYKTAILNGWMNADEVREKENMNPLPDGQGQVYLVPMNEQPVEQVLDPPEPAPIPEPEPMQETNSSEAFRKLLETVIESLIGREIAAARKAATKPKEFLRRIDEFYTEHESVMRKRLNAVPGCGNLIRQHIQRSRKAWQEITDNVVLSRCKSSELQQWVESIVHSSLDGKAGQVTQHFVDQLNKSQ